MEKLTVGDMAEINNISAQALRLYDKMKLLEPANINPKNNYRYYDIRQSACLDMIQYLKSLGMPLKEIKEQLQEQNIDVIMSFLGERLVEIDNQIEQLKVTKSAVQKMKRGLEYYKALPEQGKIIIEDLGDRLIHSYAINDDFNIKGTEYFEVLLREMKKEWLKKSLPPSYFCNIGSIINMENIFKRNFVSDKIFIWADKYSARILETEIIPSGQYICVYFESFKNEKMMRDMMLREIEEKGYELCSDFVCETIAEFPVFKKAERNTIIKIQMKIREK